MNFKTEITKIHYDKTAKGLFVKLLEFGSIFYGIGSGLKNKLYDHFNIPIFKLGNENNMIDLGDVIINFFS